MNKFIKTLQNIWSIEELRNRILLTLGLVFIYRIGTHISLPGVNPLMVAEHSAKNSSGTGILGLINVFSGGAFNQVSIFALGIMPYISASIAMQLLTIIVPQFQKMSKDGESGRRQINQWTRIFTVVVTLIQGLAYVKYITESYPQGTVYMDKVLFTVSSIFILTSGTLFAMWMGERITDKGLGNGISILIMVGILARFPGAIIQEFGARFQVSSGGAILFILEIVILILVIMAVVLLVQGTRKVPVQYAKRNIMQGGRMMQAGGNRSILPLKINAAGVMPIIFAQAIMFIPGLLAQFLPNSTSVVLQSFTDIRSFAYNITSFILIVIFTYFYTALIVNPDQIADELKRNGGFIPGVKPGSKTAEFIDTIISRITLPGAIFLGFVSIMPAIVMIFGVDQSFAMFFGGSSLIIMVGVMLDTLQTVETHLLNKHYDGLTSGGRIKGRGMAQVNL